MPDGSEETNSASLSPQTTAEEQVRGIHASWEQLETMAFGIVR